MKDDIQEKQQFVRITYRYAGVALALILALLIPHVSNSAQVNVGGSIPTVCGNGIKEGSEQCDGSDLGGQSCVNHGFNSGTLSCNLNCTFNTSVCATVSPPAPPSGGGGGGGGGGGWGGASSQAPTTVILQGRAHPGSLVTIMVDGTIRANISADSTAYFNTNIEVDPGIKSFTLYSIDKKGRRSLSYTFSLSVSSGTTSTLSGIFLSPTIETDKTEVRKGDIINILGQTAPSSTVYIYINSEEEILKEVASKADGTYLLSFNTDILEFGSHNVKSQAEIPGELISSFSQPVNFRVGAQTILKQLRGDISKNGKVDIIDFSILLFWWNKTTPDALEKADINKDNKVNLTDLSILLYYWTNK